MKIVNSISTPDKIFKTTGNEPILILCDDFNHYVCKYNRVPGSRANKLINEYIAGSFAQYWNLKVPDFILVRVKKEHIEKTHSLQPAFFNTFCFGSKYNSKYQELDIFFSEISGRNRNYFPYKSDFLKVSLFDIWICNEDRNHQNYNLLVDIENENQFIPIDHDAVFNTSNLHRGLFLISEEESLITTDFTKKLFKFNELSDRDLLKEIENDYYLCISKCKKNVDTILSEIPGEWKLDAEEMKTLLTAHLFNDKWSSECYNHFLKLIQLQLL